MKWEYYDAAETVILHASGAAAAFAQTAGALQKSWFHYACLPSHLALNHHPPWFVTHLAHDEEVESKESLRLFSWFAPYWMSMEGQSSIVFSASWRQHFAATSKGERHNSKRQQDQNKCNWWIPKMEDYIFIFNCKKFQQKLKEHLH